MSFDFSGVPTKEQFLAANPITRPSPPLQPAELTADELYKQRKQQVCNRICRFLGDTNSGEQELTVRTGFLTTEDKSLLTTALEAKGYTCTTFNGLMKIN